MSSNKKGTSPQKGITVAKLDKSDSHALALRLLEINPFQQSIVAAILAGKSFEGVVENIRETMELVKVSIGAPLHINPLHFSNVQPVKVSAEFVDLCKCTVMEFLLCLAANDGQEMTPACRSFLQNEVEVLLDRGNSDSLWAAVGKKKEDIFCQSQAYLPYYTGWTPQASDSPQMCHINHPTLDPTAIQAHQVYAPSLCGPELQKYSSILQFSSGLKLADMGNNHITTEQFWQTVIKDKPRMQQQVQPQPSQVLHVSAQPPQVPLQPPQPPAQPPVPQSIQPQAVSFASTPVLPIDQATVDASSAKRQRVTLSTEVMAPTYLQRIGNAILTLQQMLNDPAQHIDITKLAETVSAFVCMYVVNPLCAVMMQEKWLSENWQGVQREIFHLKEVGQTVVRQHLGIVIVKVFECMNATAQFVRSMDKVEQCDEVVEPGFNFTLPTIGTIAFDPVKRPVYIFTALNSNPFQ